MASDRKVTEEMNEKLFNSLCFYIGTYVKGQVQFTAHITKDIIDLDEGRSQFTAHVLSRLSWINVLDVAGVGL